MTTLNVPSSYLTIADAVAAASESDTIKVAAGYGGNESVTVTTDNLTFDIAAGVPNVVLTAGSGVSKIFANGFGPVLSVQIGDAGDNTLESGGSSLLQGAAGNDSLYGAVNSADTLDGGDGNDYITLRANNAGFGGAGDDVFSVGAFGGNTLDGGNGFDIIQISSDLLNAQVDLAAGTASSFGPPFTSIVRNIEGVYGAGGNDSIRLGARSGVAYGGSGNDTIVGGAGNDRLNGGVGYDNIAGGAGIDTVDYTLGEPGGGVTGVTVDLGAGTASDGWNSTDTLSSIENAIGSVRADNISGNSVANVLTGNEGDDTLAGRGSTDNLSGGTGNDRLIGGQGTDRLAGGLGVDTVDYGPDGGTRGVTVTLAIGAAIDSWGDSDTLQGIENIQGSGRPDTLTGDAGANVLSGGGGDDMLMGGANSDTLDGGGGTDTANYFDPAASRGVYVNLDENRAIDGYLNTDTLTGIENVIGSSHADLLQGDASDNVLTGNAGTDQLFGGTGRDTASYFDSTGTQLQGVTVNLGTLLATDKWGDADTLTSIEDLIGSSLDDALTGDGNANSLTGGAGDDILSGGGGNDLARYDDDPTTTTGVTVDLSAGTATDSWGDTDTLIGIEKVVGSRAADILTGDANANVLNGAGGNDILFGGDGDDWLLGNRGADRMEGGAGNDRYRVESTADRVIEAADGGRDTVFASIDYTLGANVENLRADSSEGLALTGNELDNGVVGGDGSDTLNGGAGRDTLTGGLGSDAFLFDSALGATNVDLVADFSVVDDTIELSHSVFTQLAAGPLAPDAFVIGSAAQDASDRIIYNSTTGVLSYDADGSGSGAAVNFARLTPGLSPTSSDFKVV